MNSKFIDFITRIKNASLARRRQFVLPYSKLNKEVGRVLVKEGFLEDIKEEKMVDKKVLKVTLKFEKRLPVFTGMKVISKQSLRIYRTKKKIFDKRLGNRTLILSTNKGIMTGREAEKKGLGGEVLFAVW